MQNTDRENSDAKRLLDLMIAFNLNLAKEQYRALLMKRIPKNKIQPPYHFYLN